MASMWGAEHDRKISAFDEDVESIEEKNFDIFKSEKSIITNAQPDKLRNHFVFTI